MPWWLIYDDDPNSKTHASIVRVLDDSVDKLPTDDELANLKQAIVNIATPTPPDATLPDSAASKSVSPASGMLVLNPVTQQMEPVP
jgi:hypothetical protein